MRMSDTRSTMPLTDTSPESRAVYAGRLAEMTPAERVRLGVALWQTAGSLQRSSILRKMPGADEVMVAFEIALTRFGPELAKAAWRRT